MKEKFILFCDWAQANWLALVIFLTIAWSCMLFILGISWLIAFWLNGLYNYKFELGSCWQGVTVVATALGSIFALAKTGWTVHRTDSELNSNLGENPNKK